MRSSCRIQTGPRGPRARMTSRPRSALPGDRWWPITGSGERTRVPHYSPLRATCGHPSTRESLVKHDFEAESGWAELLDCATSRAGPDVPRDRWKQRPGGPERGAQGPGSRIVWPVRIEFGSVIAGFIARMALVVVP